MDNMEIIVRIPTLEEESRRVMNIRNRLSFYQQHDYDVTLPDGEITAIDTDSYNIGVRAVEADRPIIEKAAQRMIELADKLHLAPPEKVTVVITKYGVGGSYDVDSGRIVVMLKPDATLMKPASHLVIHEMLHISSQQTLAVPFGLTHDQNERMIDLFCRDVFGDLLIDYRMQPMGDPLMDEALADLPNIYVEKRFIEKFGPHPVGNNPNII